MTATPRLVIEVSPGKPCSLQFKEHTPEVFYQSIFRRTPMANGGKTVAIGAAATAAIIGGKEIVEFAPVFYQTGHTIERVGVEVGTSASRTSGIVLDNLANPSDFSAGRKLLIERTEISTLPSRALLPFNNYDWDVNSVTSYFTSAEPKMLADFAKLSPPISQSAADQIIRSELVGVVQQAAKDPASNISFEAFSGKLTVDSSATIAGVKVTGGEINLYKVSLSLAGGVAACMGVIDADYQTCVQSALSKAKGLVAEQLKITSDAAAKAD
jgi:hypothetical protein